MKANQKSKVDQLAELCQLKGMRLTVQRRVILEVLSGRSDHPTADQLYKAARKRIPTMSRMTVYRVLWVLIDHGLVSRISQPGAAERFEAKTERHHHLVCRKCDEIADLDDARLDGLPLPKVAGFEISGYSVYFSGLCHECRSTAAQRKKTAKKE
jgi:Fur family peroxide stress response transcriptional regulator